MNTILSPTPDTFCACESGASSKRRFEAFTLTELLVVIAIIGILAALLFPVLGNIKQRTLSARCISNLRQCYLGIQLYSGEHRGHAPDGTWTLQIQPYLSGISNGVGSFPTSCPSLPFDDSAYGRSTYTMNSWLDTNHTNSNADGTYSWDISLKNVESPARKIMLFDGILASSSGVAADSQKNWAYSVAQGIQNIDFRHSGGAANILFVDGHASSLRYSDIYNSMWDWKD